MAIERVLVVDDEQLMRDFICEALKRKGLDVVAAKNGRAALTALQEKTFDLVLLDMKLPDMTGLDVLTKVQESDPKTITVVITAFGSVENAVEAMRMGAFNYLLKPFTPDTIETVLDKANEHYMLVKENEFLREEMSQKLSAGKPLIAKSPAMQQLLRDIERVANSNASIFITGESGTGKEVIASAIHHFSPRVKRPFVRVNCAAVPETLVESEFFGHEKGSFTGAANKRLGRFEMADTGTLLLDEITEVPLPLQAKLLRAIQEQEFERVGGSKTVKVDVRLISTSNRNMMEAIRDKVLREDLYYRLNVIPIFIPPLRDRKEDILPLANHLLQDLCRSNHKKPKRLDKGAEEKLLSYDWPGNVRELGNIIERAVVLDFGESIGPEQIYLEGMPTSGIANEPKVAAEDTDAALPLGITLQELEKRFIIETLQSHRNNRTQTAKHLGISVRTLRNKLNEYNVT